MAAASAFRQVCPMSGFWPKAARMTQRPRTCSENRQTLPPRPHMDVDPCSDREGVLLDCGQVRPRTHATFQSGDGAFRGQIFRATSCCVMPAATRADTRSATRSCSVRSRANARERLFTREAVASNARLLAGTGRKSYMVVPGVNRESL